VTRADNFKGASLKKETAKVANGKAQVSLACPAGSARGCTGALDLKTAHRVLLPGAAHKRKVNLGHATFSLGAGHKGIVRVKLTKAAKKLLLNASAVKAIATIVCHDGLGTQRRTTGKLTLTLKH